MVLMFLRISGSRFCVTGSSACMLVLGKNICVDVYFYVHIYIYLMAAANAADPKTERNRLGGSGRVGPSRAE